MKLRAREVRDCGPLDLEETVPVETMFSALPDRPSLLAPIHLNVHAEAVDDEILALIKAETRVALECSRCLEPFERPLKATVTLHAPFEVEEVEVGEQARQSLLLALPLKPLCRPDCKGLCDRCGKNRNSGPCGCAKEPAESPFNKLKDLKINK